MKYGLYSVAVVVFIISAFFVITYAAGYKLDITNRKLNQTGLISVSTDDADVYINDELLGRGKITKRDLEPGEYSVNVKKEGYFTWSKEIDLEAGEAEVINYIVLFKQTPEITEYKVEQADFLTKFADTDGLTLANGEIYQNNNYVTRFAQPISGLCWYTDRRYLAYTADNKLKVSEIDGTNEVSLVDKNSQTPVVFVNSGRTMIFENNSKTYQAKIR